MRISRKKELLDTIKQNGKFDIHDFTVVERRGYFRLDYDYSDLDYCFSFKEPKGTTLIESKDPEFPDERYISVYKFDGYMMPGGFSDREDFNTNGIFNLKYELNSWLNNLDEELDGYHINRKFSKVYNDIEGIKTRIDNVFGEDDTLDGYLNDDEVSALKERLDMFEQEFQEKISQFIENEEELKAEIEKLHNDFEDFRSSTTRMSKKNWLKKFTIGIAGWISESENRRKLIAGSKVMMLVCKSFGIEVPESIVMIVENSLDDSTEGS